MQDHAAIIVRAQPGYAFKSLSVPFRYPRGIRDPFPRFAPS